MESLVNKEGIELPCSRKIFDTIIKDVDTNEEVSFHKTTYQTAVCGVYRVGKEISFGEPRTKYKINLRFERSFDVITENNTGRIYPCPVLISFGKWNKLINTENIVSVRLEDYHNLDAFRNTDEYKEFIKTLREYLPLNKSQLQDKSNAKLYNKLDEEAKEDYLSLLDEVSEFVLKKSSGKILVRLKSSGDRERGYDLVFITEKIKNKILQRAGINPENIENVVYELNRVDHKDATDYADRIYKMKTDKFNVKREDPSFYKKRDAKSLRATQKVRPLENIVEEENVTSEPIIITLDDVYPGKYRLTVNTNGPIDRIQLVPRQFKSESIYSISITDAEAEHLKNYMHKDETKKNKWVIYKDDSKYEYVAGQRMAFRNRNRRAVADKLEFYTKQK